MIVIDRTAQASRHVNNLSGTQILSTHGTSRPVDNIDAIMLHQLTFARASARESFDSVIAHYVLLLNGEILQVRHLDALLNDAWGGTCIHFEFEGNYPNENGGIWCPRPRGERRRRGPLTCESHVPSAEQIQAGRDLILKLKRQLPDIRHVYAHRQASRLHRDNCPGPHIWYNVARWAMDPGNGLGLDSVVDRPRRGARRQEQKPIPVGWSDPRFEIPV